MESGQLAAQNSTDEEDDQVAQVTVKLDWVTGSCVQVQEIQYENEDQGQGEADAISKKKKPSRRRELAGRTFNVVRNQ